MLSISRFSTSTGLGMDALGEALLNFGFLRTGVRRAGTRELSDHLRRDLGLLPRSERPSDLRDPRW
ncbi:MAG TPA: hypothetical protein VJ790_07475 [Dongiaceae bacterium]|nr:hypothetical protein [Dongiaceae bacterium]